MKDMPLWLFNLIIFIITQVVFGVEGWSVWGIAAFWAWWSNRLKPIGQKDYKFASALWLLLAFLLIWGKTH